MPDIERERESEIIVSVKNEVVVAYYKVLFQHLTRGTEKNDVSP